MYKYGYGVAQNYDMALKLYKEYAASGNAWAQREIGHMYENGYGVPQNVTTALEWYKKAAEQGDEYAQGRLQVLQPFGGVGAFASLFKV